MMCVSFDIASVDTLSFIAYFNSSALNDSMCCRTILPILPSDKTSTLIGASALQSPILTIYYKRYFFTSKVSCKQLTNIGFAVKKGSINKYAISTKLRIK